MDDGQLLAAIKAREASSYGWDSGELAEQRSEAIRRFVGDKLGDEREGRSQVVPTTLRDVYLWIAPQLLRVFLGTDEVVRFEPTGPEDESAAQQETEVVNHIATQQNNAFVQFSAWFQDACLCGSGYVKVWWDVDESVTVERYFGKSDEELAFLLNDPEVELVSQQTYPDPEYVEPPPQIDPATGMQMPVPPQSMAHDVELRRTTANEYARYEAVPPEEIAVSKSARSVSLQDCDFVQHKRLRTISDLRESGYDVPDDIGDGGDDDDSLEDEARDRWGDDDDDSGGDPASRRVLYRESYIRIDYDGDGKAELRKVCHIGSTLLHNEEADCVPFACIAPILFAHRHVGLSLYDLLKEIEKIRVALTRAYLDGVYLSVAPRIAFDQNSVEQGDLLDSKPGGLVRVNGTPGDKVMPLPVPDTGPIAMQGLQWLDQWKQDASGVNQSFQGGPGLDASALNKTASGVAQLVSQAQMRVEAIARSFADTGVRDLFRLLHGLTLKHARKALTIKLRNQWTVVDPRSWRKRTDLACTVALGAGTKEMRAAQLQQLIALQLQVAPMGLATPDKLYNSISRLCNELGYRNPDEFVANPAMMPPQPPPPPDPLVQAEQVKSQTTLQKTQMELQAQQGADQRELALKQAELQQQAELERFKAQLQAEQSRFEAELKAQTTIQVAQITEQIKTDHAMRSKVMDVESAQAERTSNQEERLQLAQVVSVLEQMRGAFEALAGEVSRRSSGRIVRDARGRVAGTVDEQGNPISMIERDGNGRVAGIRPADNLQ